MMVWKKKWLLLGLAIILIVALFVFNQCKLYRIDKSRVVRIEFNNQELTAEETDRFISQFNHAIYAGKSTGDGGTPLHNFTVYFTDGSYMWVSDFDSMGKDFEISVRNSMKMQIAGYYLNSQALWNFMLELAEQ